MSKLPYHHNLVMLHTHFNATYASMETKICFIFPFNERASQILKKQTLYFP